MKRGSKFKKGRGQSSWMRQSRREKERGVEAFQVHLAGSKEPGWSEEHMTLDL